MEGINMKINKYIGISVLLAVAILANSAWAVKAADKRTYSNHSYHQQKPKPQEVKEILPEIIHNPPLQISSTEDFFVSATINNLGIGVPIIHYRFDGDNNYYKRALRKAPSGQFQFKILSAALTGKQLEYYIEVATGSKVLATLGTDINPIKVAIIAPAHNMIMLYLAIAAAVIGLVIKLVISINNKTKALKEKDKTSAVKAVEVKKKKRPQLSARSR
jgi:hypothetical protein